MSEIEIRPKTPSENEVTPIPPSDFAVSTMRLFEALDSFGDDTNDHRFYQIEWSDDNPSEVTNIRVVDLEPTGARRQFFGGKFSRAQFVATEVGSSNSAADRQYIWCYTGPQSRGTFIETDSQALQRDHKYYKLSAETVPDVLAAKASATEDLIALLSAIRSRGIEPSPSIIKLINAATYQMVNHGMEVPGTRLTEQSFRDTLFTILTNMGDRNTEAVTNLQSQVLSKLIRASAQRIGNYDISQQREAVQAASLGIIEEALQQGILPKLPRITDRLFRHPPFFRLPLATELLYEELRSPRFAPTRINISGVKRGAFAHDYMMAMLDARVRSSDVVPSPLVGSVKNTLRYAELYTYQKPPFSYDKIFKLARLALQSETETSAEPTNPSRPNDVRITSVSQAFSSILKALPYPESEDATRQNIIDAKAVAIVRIALGNGNIRRRLIISNNPVSDTSSTAPTAQ